MAMCCIARGALGPTPLVTSSVWPSRTGVRRCQPGIRADHPPHDLPVTKVSDYRGLEAAFGRVWQELPVESASKAWGAFRGSFEPLHKRQGERYFEKIVRKPHQKHERRSRRCE